VEHDVIVDQQSPTPRIEVDVEPTGDADVDAALERLAEIPERATPEHAEVYEDVHRRLQAALADLGSNR
jgi:broad specificity phosphatase PhoE